MQPKILYLLQAKTGQSHETLVTIYQPIRCNTLQDLKLHNHCCRVTFDICFYQERNNHNNVIYFYDLSVSRIQEEKILDRVELDNGNLDGLSRLRNVSSD
jgi:hypothetical protein